MKTDKTSKYVLVLAEKAKEASRKLSLVSGTERGAVLLKMAEAILSKQDFIARENEKDLKEAKKKNYAKALVERLVLNEKRIKEMAESLREISRLSDPLGKVLENYKRPNGLSINKVSVPIGVIGIIYESRPNVTSDCVGLCLKSGNAVILKGGKEALFSNKAIFGVLRDALKGTGIPEDAIQLIPSSDRKGLEEMLKLVDLVDLIVPRGGESLIKFVADNSRIPVVKHYKGICHVYVSDKADVKMAEEICFNSKVQRPGVCNAMETMLVHKNIADSFMPSMIKRFIASGVELRGCALTRKLFKEIKKKATEQDWYEEYLDLILSVKIVDSTDEAIGHINKYSSHHSDSIVTEDKNEAQKFLDSVDSACVYWNASTRFTDGYQFGLGAEVGISTDKLHVRGPMGLEGLTTYKYEIYGTGQVRT
ncbi:MAG: glutamate-5-semialdehyde dehydrogenase [Candidatus Omnitrophica bacterium]|nr:glutamate-5-semialdehyde dehydrogenase [Candidatus Omnitrophota bacterium]